MKLKLICTRQNVTRTERTVLVSEISESSQRRYDVDQFLEFRVEIKVSRTLYATGSRSESSYLADLTSRTHICSLWQSHLQIQCQSCICENIWIWVVLVKTFWRRKNRSCACGSVSRCVAASMAPIPQLLTNECVHWGLTHVEPEKVGCHWLVC